MMLQDVGMPICQPLRQSRPLTWQSLVQTLLKPLLVFHGSSFPLLGSRVEMTDAKDCQDSISSHHQDDQQGQHPVGMGLLPVDHPLNQWLNKADQEYHANSPEK